MCAGTISADATCQSESPPRTPLVAMLRHIARHSGFNGTWQHRMTFGPDAPKASGLQRWGLFHIDPSQAISPSLACAPQFLLFVCETENTLLLWKVLQGFVVNS